MRATGWSPQKHLFFQKSILWVIIKIISKFSPAWKVVFDRFCVFMSIITEIFTERSRSPAFSDMEMSLQSCSGPFRDLQKCSNWVKVGKIQTFFFKLDFPSFFRYISICLVFSFFSFFFRFFSLFFSFLFSILVFCRFWIKFGKIPKLQKKPRVFFGSFSFLSVSFFRIIFDPKKHFRIMFELVSIRENNFQFRFF